MEIISRLSHASLLHPLTFPTRSLAQCVFIKANLDTHTHKSLILYPVAAAAASASASGQ